MYTIIGGDGREYGPVPAEQIRAWIAAGRANLETQAKAAGTAEWKPLGEFADFGGRIGGAPAFEADEPAPVPVPSARPVLAAAPPEFSPLDCFARSWDLLKQNFLPLVGVTAIVCGAELAVELATGPKTEGVTDIAALFDAYRSYAGSTAFRLQEAANILVLLPLFAGYQFYILKRARQQAASVRDVFAGFSAAYPALVLAAILILVFTTLGLLCFVLPGIYLAVAYYAFTFLAIVDRRLGTWAAMEGSRRAVTRHWWSVLLLFIIGLLLCLAGLIAFGAGMLITLPLVVGAFAYAYDDLCGGPVKSEPEPVNSAPQPTV
jgi:uncharacterized membrane protein